MLVAKDGGKPLVFSDDTGDLLKSLGIGESALSSGILTLDPAATVSGSAYKYSVSRDGVLVGTGFQSMSNTLDLSDAGFEGISVQVSETGKTNFSVSADSAGAMAKVKAFIDAYNAVRQDIEDSTKVTSVDGKVTTSVEPRFDGGGLQFAEVHFYADDGADFIGDDDVRFDGVDGDGIGFECFEGWV
jgi:hypothetical protein